LRAHDALGQEQKKPVWRGWIAIRIRLYPVSTGRTRSEQS
jgi:hypothetical protein